MLLLKHIDDNLFILDYQLTKPVSGYYYDTYLDKICNTGGAEYSINDVTVQIIAQLKDQLKGVPLFPMPEEKVDVEKLASRHIKNCVVEMDEEQKYHRANGFIAGHNRCLSDNKERKYTENDIHHIANQVWRLCVDKQNVDKYVVSKLIQSLTTQNLQQYDGKEVEIEMEHIGLKDGSNHHNISKPKLTNGKITITKIL